MKHLMSDYFKLHPQDTGDSQNLGPAVSGTARVSGMK